MRDALGRTDITVADWLEVIGAVSHEIPNLHTVAPPVKAPSVPDLLTVEGLVTLAEVECLKRARREAYMLAN